MLNKAILILSLCLTVWLSAGCTSPKSDENPVTPPAPELSLAIEAQPQAIRADGTSRLVVFVQLQDGELPVADSTQVILLNTIGTLGRGIVFTHSGVALDTLTSDTTAASGWLIAYSEGTRDSVEIIFTRVQ
jgi:hypothetical protein